MIAVWGDRWKGETVYPHTETLHSHILLLMIEEINKTRLLEALHADST